jgi:hypothetical protein
MRRQLIHQKRSGALELYHPGAGKENKEQKKGKNDELPVKSHDLHHLL